MRRYHWLDITVFVLLLTSICYSQSFFIGGGLSVASDNDNTDGGIGFNAFFGYELSGKALVKGSIGRYTSDAKMNILMEGDYSLLWLEGSYLRTLRASFLRMGPEPKIKPYGGAGGGYYLFEHEISPYIQTLLSQAGIEWNEEIQNTFGVHIRGGLDFELSPTIMINIDLKYNYLKPKVDIETMELEMDILETFEEEIDLSTIIISVGLKVSI